MTYIELIAKNVRKLRIKYYYSQRELAQRSDLSESTIWKIEHGKVRARMSTLMKLRYPLNCEITDLYRGVKYDRLL